MRQRPATSRWSDPYKDPHYHDIGKKKKGFNAQILGDSSDEEAGGQRRRQVPSRAFVNEMATNPRAREFYSNAVTHNERLERDRKRQDMLDEASALERKRKEKERLKVSGSEVLWAGIIVYGSLEVVRRTIAGPGCPPKVIDENILTSQETLGGATEGSSTNAAALAAEEIRSAARLKMEHVPIPVHMIVVACLFFFVVVVSHLPKILMAYRHSMKHNHSFFKANIFGVTYCFAFMACLAVVVGNLLLSVLGISNVPPSCRSPDVLVLPFPLPSIAALCLAAGALHRLSRVVI